MENRNSNGDNGLVAWASSFSGAANPKLYAARDHTHYQHLEGLGSQSRSYQQSQLTSLISTDIRPPATPQSLLQYVRKEAGEQQQRPESASPTTKTHTLSAIGTRGNAAIDTLDQQRSAEDTTATPTTTSATASTIAAAAKFTRSLTHNCVQNSEACLSPCSLSSSSTLPHPSKIPLAAVAAAATGMHPVYASHPSAVEDGDMEADMEVKRERLEDYLDLQDDDDISDNDGSSTARDLACSGHPATDLTHSCSRHSQWLHGINSSSLWITDLCHMAGGDANNSNSCKCTSVTGRDSDENLLQRSPCTPIEVDGRSGSAAASTNNNSTTAGLQSPGAVGRGGNELVGRTGFAAAKKVQPPPLSGFTPVTTAESGSTPSGNKANVGRTNTNANNINCNSCVANMAANVNRGHNNITTPQPLSLGSSLKVSPSSHQSSVDLVEEERRLREELQTLRLRVWETEQKLTNVQMRIAESSGNATINTTNKAVAAPAGAGRTAEGVHAQHSGQRQQQQQQPPPPLPLQSMSTATKTQAESNSLDSSAVTLLLPGLHAVTDSTGPRHTVCAPPLELKASPNQQQSQHHLTPSAGSTVYISGASPSASATMTRPVSSDPSGLASSGMTSYRVQNKMPFGVYAIPLSGTLVDAACSPVQNTRGSWGPVAAAPNAGNAPTNAGAAVFPASLPPGVQVLGTQQYVIKNNQPTVCYMVVTPQQPQPQPQPQRLTASGLFSASVQPPPEFGSISANNSNNANYNSSVLGGAGNSNNGNADPHVKSAALSHLPAFPATSASSGGKVADGSPSYSHVVMVGPASNGELTRKCFNVHGSMMGVVQYFAYDESAPPAPTATILTTAAANAASPNASMLGQSLSGICGWSTRSINGILGPDVGLGGSCRSHDGFAGNDSTANAPRSNGSSTPNAKGTTTMPADLSTAPVLPIFIQMFPCELHDRATVLNRVMEATCQRGFAVVQRIEPRSETSFIAHVRTHQVWQLIYKLRCRVLMDRFGFWYAADLDQYVRMKEYCEGVRRLPQQTRHFQTDGLPCMPLVVELSRAVDKAVITDNNAPRTFDEIVPIAAVDRHRTRLYPTNPPTAAATTTTPAASGVTGANANATGGGSAGSALLPVGAGADNMTGFPSAMSASGVFKETNPSGTATNNIAPILPGVPLKRGGLFTATVSEASFLGSGNAPGGSTRAGQAVHADVCPSSPPPFM